MTWTTIQAVTNATKAAIMSVREADNPNNSARPLHTVPRTGDLVLKQPIFYWKVAGKYQETCNFEIEICNNFMTNSYNKHESERVPRM